MPWLQAIANPPSIADKLQVRGCHLRLLRIPRTSQDSDLAERGRRSAPVVGCRLARSERANGGRDLLPLVPGAGEPWQDPDPLLERGRPETGNVQAAQTA